MQQKLYYLVVEGN